LKAIWFTSVSMMISSRPMHKNARPGGSLGPG
jgi:hypothetical protein